MPGGAGNGTPVVGSVVRLKPGVQPTDLGTFRLQPGELATITDFRDMDGEMFLKRQRDGVEIIYMREDVY